MTMREARQRANPAGNERLTAMTGAVLLALFAAECLTLLNIGKLLFKNNGPDGGWQWVQLHHEAFLLWALVMVIHLGSYVPRLPRILAGQPAERARTVLAARPTRWLLLGGSVALGLVLAFATYHLSVNWGGSGSLIP